MPNHWSTSRLAALIQAKQSYLCVGLDNQINDLPPGFPATPQGLMAYSKLVIELTRPYAIAYKFNTAFYEEMGSVGWSILEELVYFAGEEVFRIADAKRGDIGNTAQAYARAFFESMNADAVTVNPYMGRDSIEPFLDYPGKYCIALGITSNPGASDIQKKLMKNGEAVYEYICSLLVEWGSPEQLMLVVGATQSDELARLRKRIPHHFFLVPGVGTQGGNLESVLNFGKNVNEGIIINASRGINFAWKSSELTVEQSIINSAQAYSAHFNPRE